MQSLHLLSSTWRNFSKIFKKILTLSPAIFTHLFPTSWGAGSSVGRASALQAEGHRFEPCSAHHVFYIRGAVVKLVITLACHARGREFESRRPRHNNQVIGFSVSRNVLPELPYLYWNEKPLKSASFGGFFLDKDFP